MSTANRRSGPTLRTGLSKDIRPVRHPGILDLELAGADLQQDSL
jgi:hypothetical protein